MSHTAAPVEGLRQALCLECGAVRSAKARYLGRGSRPLRCEFEGLMHLFRTCHIDVLVDEADLTSPNAEPQGGLVDVVRWLDPEGYLVRLQRGLSLADRVHALDWAWRSIRPTIARWERCTIESDADGHTFQRIYNNELETGVFELS
jgi:hypothetical protein